MVRRCAAVVAVFAAVLIGLVAPLAVVAEESVGEHRPLAVSVWPAVNLPLGAAAAAVDAGLSGDIGLQYRFAALPLYAGLEVSYTYAGLKSSGSISPPSAIGTIGARFALTPWLYLVAGGFVGVGRAALVFGEVDGAQFAIGYGALAGLSFRFRRVELDSNFSMRMRPLRQLPGHALSTWTLLVTLSVDSSLLER